MPWPYASALTTGRIATPGPAIRRRTPTFAARAERSTSIQAERRSGGSPARARRVSIESPVGRGIPQGSPRERRRRSPDAGATEVSDAGSDGDAGPAAPAATVERAPKPSLDPALSRTATT